MHRVTVILVCVVATVLAQNENGLSFTNSPGTTKPPGTPTLAIVNPGCMCALIGTCPTSPSTGIDIRIVNNGPPQPTCPTGYVLCCSASTTNPPSSPDTTCGIRKIPATPQTVAGQASFGAYPWHVALLNLQESFIGSGVLLDSTHVLTAAHKVAAYANNPSSILVRLGEWNAQSQSEPYNYVQAAVARIVLHPNFNPSNLENDVAVIRINGVINIASYPNVNTACKPTTAPVTGARCYVSGWGKNLFGPGGAYQSIMREVDVPILDNTDCENRLKQTRLGAAYVLNKNSFMCAGGENGKDACTGDGGSPLVCQRSNGQWQVVGIVAWGIGCASPGVPGVYTNVFNFLSWINQVIATA